MKMERISEHIWSLKSWMLVLPVHVWLVVGDDGVTLVDAGFGGMARGILSAVEQFGPLRRILLTHGHSDHVGSVAAVVARHRVPVYAHRIELPYLNGEMPYPRRKKAGASTTPGLVQALAEDESGALAAVDGLRPYLTPGHSPGHVVYYHAQDEVLLAGDLFTSRAGKLRPPMAIFTADMAEAVRSSAIVAQVRPRRLEVCHGEAVLQPADQLDAYRQAMR